MGLCKFVTNLHRIVQEVRQDLLMTVQNRFFLLEDNNSNYSQRLYYTQHEK